MAAVRCFEIDFLLCGSFVVNESSYKLRRESLALFKKFCKRDFCDEVRDFKIPEPEAVAS